MDYSTLANALAMKNGLEMFTLLKTMMDEFVPVDPSYPSHWTYRRLEKGYKPPVWKYYTEEDFQRVIGRAFVHYQLAILRRTPEAEHMHVANQLMLVQSLLFRHYGIVHLPTIRFYINDITGDCATFYSLAEMTECSIAEIIKLIDERDPDSEQGIFV